MVGRWAPADEEIVELSFGGWENALFAFPGWVLKVHDYDVQDFAEVDGIAKNCFT